ncbi:molecular chaperone TorD family protein [Salinilacihabitans rarus]|uniref:molecular chaperone TorD family protein n=1 Tax=Salinilacihabitans rarus TaxID=2961596 RepID=UPI0020C8FEA6|nr:molecular chaperone TorD family protein [Salinilacihabitans rarus]
MSERTDRDVGGFEVDEPAAARGALYALLARGFEAPGERFAAAAADGTLAATCERLLAASALDVDAPTLDTADDRRTLQARYNDLFVTGYVEYEDRTDGTLDATGPAVSLYESSYRSDVAWTDVNLDLARAYEYFGLAVDESRREHHDHLRLQLEFAGYLARREAAVSADAAGARLDLHDRHLRYVAAGVAERLDAEPGTGLYGDLGRLLDRFTAADRADLVERLDDGGVGAGRPDAGGGDR